MTGLDFLSAPIRLGEGFGIVNAIARLPDPARALLQYWKAERQTHGLPHKSAMDPLKLREWVGDLSVIEVHDGPARFFIRLHGSMTSEYIGKDFSRQYLEDCTPDHARDLAVQPYVESIGHRKPTFSVLVPGLVTGVFKSLERLVMPFTAADAPHGDTAPVSHFLVWVAPTELDQFESATVYGDVEPTKAERQRAEEAMRLVVIDVDDPHGPLAAPRRVEHPLLRLCN